MTESSLVQTWHFPHRAVLVILGDSLPEIMTSCDDHMITEVDTAGSTVINDMITNQGT